MTVPQPYNLSGLENVTGFVGFMQDLNSTLMNDLLGVLILVTIFIISLIVFMQSTGRIEQSFAASSFIIFVLGILLRAIDLISDSILYIGCLGLLIISAAMLYKNSD